MSRTSFSLSLQSTLRKALLLLPGIPTKFRVDTLDPLLAPPSLHLNAGKRIPARADGHVVARPELDTLTTVKTRPRAGPSIVGHADAKHNGIWQDDGPEGERVSANSGHEHDGVLGVAEGAAGSEVVCG